jgi:hypothetical protein
MDNLYIGATNVRKIFVRHVGKLVIHLKITFEYTKKIKWNGGLMNIVIVLKTRHFVWLEGNLWSKEQKLDEISLIFLILSSAK